MHKICSYKPRLKSITRDEVSNLQHHRQDAQKNQSSGLSIQVRSAPTHEEARIGSATRYPTGPAQEEDIKAQKET